MADLRFDGRVAVVTGAARGIGRAHAVLLASRGAKVVVNDIGVKSDGTNPEAGPADHLVNGIVAAGGTAIADTNSVATEEGARALVARAVDSFGRIDVLIHNAGLVNVGMEALLDIHLRAACWLTAAAWEPMRTQEFGRILLTTSNAGLYGHHIDENDDMHYYGAAKMGAVGLMRSLSLRGAAYNINVNALSPVAATTIGRERADESQTVAARPPDPSDLQGRAPEYVAATVAWLVHEDCAASGEVFGASSGTVTRTFIAETRGYSNPALTPELVRDHFAEICDETDYTVPPNFIDCPHVQAAVATL